MEPAAFFLPDRYRIPTRRRFPGTKFPLLTQAGKGKIRLQWAVPYFFDVLDDRRQI